MNQRMYYYLVCILLMTLLAAGCTGKTPQAVYYTLSSTGDDSALQSARLSDAIVIGVGPVKFPDELDRPSIVTRSGQNRLEVNEFHRWGGSLEKNFTRVMVENLAFLMKTDQVMARPWERYFQPDARIAIDIRQFEGRLGDHALLNATWMVFQKGEDLPKIVRRTVIKEAVTDDTYDALVAAQSLLVSRLCVEIAEALAENRPAQ